MSFTSPVIHLRAIRRKAGLTQQDLGQLLAIKPSLLSKYERRKLSLPAHTLIACCIIFHCSPADIHPELIEEINQTTKRNAKKLKQQAKPNNLVWAKARNATLTDMIQRIP